MENIWVKYTKFVHGHLSNENYFLIDKEIVEDNVQMDYLCLDWAGKDNSGYYAGFEYFWVIETPPIEWLTKKCEYTNQEIESLNSYYYDLKKTIDILKIINNG